MFLQDNDVGTILNQVKNIRLAVVKASTVPGSDGDGSVVSSADG